jgi:hypothetical protein
VRREFPTAGNANGHGTATATINFVITGGTAHFKGEWEHHGYSDDHEHQCYNGVDHRLLHWIPCDCPGT